MKQFWDDQEEITTTCSEREEKIISALRKLQGMFFWNELIIFYKRLKYSNKEIIKNINIYLETRNLELTKDLPDNTDRLLTKYALACLGEEKVKELILTLK